MAAREQDPNAVARRPHALAVLAPRKLGRPIDATAESRILAAGIQLYGLEGWRGTTMSAIASEAKVGKSLLYSRFGSPAEILVAAFETFITELTGDFDTVRDLLLAEANRMADLYLGPYSLPIRRALVDAVAGVEPFGKITEDMSRRTVLPMRRRIRAAVDSGELPPWTRITPLLDVIEGAVRMHVFAAAPHLADRVRANIRSYTEQLVDEQLLLLATVGPLRGYPDIEWIPPVPANAGLPRPPAPAKQEPVSPREGSPARMSETSPGGGGGI